MLLSLSLSPLCVCCNKNEKDNSPATPAAWPPLNPTPPPALPPPLTAHQITLLQQQVTDVITKTPIQELISQIKKVGFPSTCMFVLNLLEKYVLLFKCETVIK